MAAACQSGELYIITRMSRARGILRSFPGGPLVGARYQTPIAATGFIFPLHAEIVRSIPPSDGFG